MLAAFAVAWISWLIVFYVNLSRGAAWARDLLVVSFD
jgi:hypothetical protein